MMVFLFGFMYPASVTGNYKTYGENLFNDDEFLSTAGSIASVFNGVSRIFFGFLFDIYSFRLVYGIVIYI